MEMEIHMNSCQDILFQNIKKVILFLFFRLI